MFCFIAIIAVSGTFGQSTEQKYVNRNLITFIEESSVPKNSRDIRVQNSGRVTTFMTQEEILSAPCFPKK